MKSKAVTFANFLRQPYPYYFHQRSLGKLTFGVFVLSFFVVYLFEPFNVNSGEHKMDYFWISLLHILVSCLVFFICFTAINLYQVGEERWTVGKEILSLIFVLLIMGLGNFFIRDLLYNNSNNWSLHYLLEEVRNTFLVGILLTMILIPLNFARIYHRNTRKAESFAGSSMAVTFPAVDQILITTQLKSDDFYLSFNDFLYAKSEGNYVEFYLSIDDGVHKLLKRVTIKELERQLQEFPWLFKTHRSYLVNLKRVTAVSGNAQGYQLSLEQDAANVPVSRGMIKKFDHAFTSPTL